MKSQFLGIAMAVTMATACAPGLAWEATSTKAESASLAGNTDVARTCCKICRTGKACGNSCISRDKNCHQPPGCACNGALGFEANDCESSEELQAKSTTYALKDN